jgi:hypothetical protein
LNIGGEKTILIFLSAADVVSLSIWASGFVASTESPGGSQRLATPSHPKGVRRKICPNSPVDRHCRGTISF